MIVVICVWGGGVGFVPVDAGAVPVGRCRGSRMLLAGLTAGLVGRGVRCPCHCCSWPPAMRCGLGASAVLVVPLADGPVASDGRGPRCRRIMARGRQGRGTSGRSSGQADRKQRDRIRALHDSIRLFVAGVGPCSARLLDRPPSCRRGLGPVASMMFTCMRGTGVRRTRVGPRDAQCFRGSAAVACPSVSATNRTIDQCRQVSP